MELKEITDRNYAATVKRGLIVSFTSAEEFIDKIEEENTELRHSIWLDNTFDESELADVTLVCFAMAKHFDIDLIETMKEKMLYNEKRID